MPTPAAHSPRIVRIITPEAKQAFAQSAPSTHLSYGGGTLLTSVEVVTVFWGAAWTKAPQSGLIPRLNAFFDFILKSALIDLLGEYSVPGKTIGHGRRIGTVTIANSEPGGSSKSIDDGGIQQALQNFIHAGRLPRQNANTLYFVYLPPGVTSSLFFDTSCTAFCGYHNNTGGFTSGGDIFYAVVPFVDCGGCMVTTDIFDTLTKVSSHELCEAITDPAPGSGWKDADGEEIADICNTDIVTLGGFFVQTEWSNRASACVLSGHDHFYTTDFVERCNAIAHGSYRGEGVACYVLPSQSGSARPLHRLRRKLVNQHFYTTDDAERDHALQHGFVSEGEACFVFAQDAAGRVPLHRLLNSESGEHFYTTSDAERDNAVANLGFQLEGEACFVFSGEEGVDLPVFRLRSADGHKHLYTASQAEADTAITSGGWVAEGVAWFAALVPHTGAVPLHRLYNAQTEDHFYTTDDAERDHAIASLAYVSEHEACYVYSAQQPNSVPLHRLYHSVRKQHFYTTNDAERDHAIQLGGYRSEGESGFVDPKDLTGRAALYRLFRAQV